MIAARLRERYRELAHAIQSALAFQISTGSECASPKHLRVGLDLSKADQGALATLLIAKGVFTQAEYDAALIAGLERELEFQTAEAKKCGAPDQMSFA